MTLGEGASKGRMTSPPPIVGATLIAASAVVLVVGVVWLNRGDPPTDRVAPTADGVTRPTDADGDEVEIPPSQPAVAVSFGPGGQILRPDPVRARVIDDTGAEVLITLPPNTTVDTVTGAIVPISPGGTGSGGTPWPTSPGTTRPGGTTPPTSSTPTTPSPTTTEPPTTETTTTTTEPTTTTESTTTTTEPTPPDPMDPTGLLDALLP